MIRLLETFVGFYLITIFFRFVIGIPVTCSRMQTKYKFSKIPAFLNILLFLSISKKPISLYIIVYQIHNIIVFLVLLIISVCKSSSEYILLFKILSTDLVIIVILPLAVETIIGIIRGTLWVSEDKRVNISFENCEISFHYDKIYNFHFGTFIGNKIVFYKDKDIVGYGSIDYKKRTVKILSLDNCDCHIENTSLKFYKSSFKDMLA